MNDLEKFYGLSLVFLLLDCLEKNKGLGVNDLCDKIAPPDVYKTSTGALQQRVRNKLNKLEKLGKLKKTAHPKRHRNLIEYKYELI